MERLDRFEAELACSRLVALYGRASDGGRGVEDLFAEDGVLHIYQRLQGREAMRAARELRPKNMLTRHITTDVVIDMVDEDHARGTCYVTAHVLPEGGSELGLPAVVGEYTDEFVRTDAGWKFASRVFTPVLTARP